MNIRFLVLPFIAFSMQSAQAGVEAILNEAEAVSIPHVSLPSKITKARPYREAAFTGQGKALGYHSTAFSTPKGLEKQVQFWTDVYTKYSSSDGIIHDSENVEKIYRIVDLSGLKSEKERQNKIDEVKKEIAAGLKDQTEIDRLRYQLGLKDRMRDAIFFSGRYIEEMEDVFRKENLPIELTRIVFVESSFNILARSKVGASGLWQIMPYTAKPYRMISSAVDKRNDPIEATKIAAKLLRQNYNMLQSWPLAVTGYNHGPTGVRKVTQTYGTRELGELVTSVKSRKSFGFASRHFYASFLAALEVERNAKKYFGDTVVWSEKLETKQLKVPKPIKWKEVVSWFDGDDTKAQVYNPHFTYSARKGGVIPRHSVVKLPTASYEVVKNSFDKKRTVAMEGK